jgi:hypothetical protein
MDRACNQLLAGAGLADDQDAGFGRRDQLDLVEDCAHRMAVADNLLVVGIAAQLVLQISVFQLQLLLQRLDFLKRAPQLVAALSLYVWPAPPASGLYELV